MRKLGAARQADRTLTTQQASSIPSCSLSNPFPCDYHEGLALRLKLQIQVQHVLLPSHFIGQAQYLLDTHVVDLRLNKMHLQN